MLHRVLCFSSCLLLSLLVQCTQTATATPTDEELTSLSVNCPITNSTTVVYSTVNGVGPASLIWVEDLLWWWQQTDPNVQYIGLTSEDFVNCDLKSFPNLKLYVNPGGDAYDQVAGLGTAGTANIKAFITRDQTLTPSGYAGFCAGGYIASHDYIWETLYQGTDYYEYSENPPLSLFPHTVEGSIVDINDDQYGDQSGSKYRVVNVSNGHHMVYYGGSTFGYNGVLDYTNPSSSVYDPEVEVLIYYTDFYGYYSYNLPAAWKYRNVVSTSVHPEADNCTSAREPDCPPAGTLHSDQILQNRAWILGYMNDVSQSNFKIPEVPIQPVFETHPPHAGYPAKKCYTETGVPTKYSTTATRDASINPASHSGGSAGIVLFCDDFDSEPGTVSPGLAPQFQRNQTDYNYAKPWNTSYVSVWNSGVEYPSAYAGDGYAVCVPTAVTPHHSSILTKPVPISSACQSYDLVLSFQYVKQTRSTGYLSVEYSYDSVGDSDGSADKWHVLSMDDIANSEGTEWSLQEYIIPYSAASTVSATSSADGANSTGVSARSKTPVVRVRITCAAGPSVTEYCAMDELRLTC